MSQKVSSTNTKAQILDAYNKLLKEIEQKAADNPKEVKNREEKNRL